MMPRKSIKSALSDSLKAEDAAVKNRFDIAERLLGQKLEEGVPLLKDQEEPPLQRVIRDSFTLPVDDYALIAQTQQRCLQGAVNVSKSEVIRAGLQALRQMTQEELLEVVQRLEKVRTGRPAAKK